ncbi:multidrug resistance protein homolog 49-like isoform X2 [Lycorma delicatula]
MVKGLHFELQNDDNTRFRNTTKGDKFVDEDITDECKSLSHSNFSTCFEKFLFVLGLILAVIAGTIQPILNKLYGEFLSLLIGRFTPNAVIEKPFFLSYFGGGFYKPNATEKEQMEFLIKDSHAYFIITIAIAIFQFLVCFSMVVLLSYCALKKVGRMRRYFLKSLLQQDMTWHDMQNSGTGLSAKMTELDKLPDSLNENLGMAVFLISSFIANLTVGFCLGWKLTLILLSVAPVFVGGAALVNKKKNTMFIKENESCKNASAVAQEVISSIRTVAAFNGEEKEVKRFKDQLSVAQKLSVLSSIYNGLGTGISWMMMFFSYSICFWYGTPLILDDRPNEVKEYSPGVIAGILFCIAMGELNIGIIGPFIESIIKGRVAANNAHRILKRRSEINPFSNSGKIINGKVGTIEFKNVYFNYPTRPDVKVLQGFDLKINQGECIALVGSSGSGKSTTIQLLERFYDPNSGSVLLEGVDIRDLHISWLRQQIGLVGQEPVLFNTTIAKNICGDLNISHEDMVKAAQDANVHDFICSLPEGYDTVVGESGSRFSGGQKQRIAIARALVRNPSILLLDEATSALDVASEAIVQNALDIASKGRTTLIIAHRLSSIQNVDRIVVIDKGYVIEQGTHDQLMEKEGKYYNLVSADATLQHNLKNKVVNGITCNNNDIKDPADVLLEPNTNENNNEEVTFNSTDHRPSWTRLVKLNKPELGYVIIGSICALLVGISSPVSSVLYGGYNGVLANEDKDYVIKMANWYSFCFVFVAVITFLAIFIQFSFLGIAGTRLTNRLRITLFSVILKQEISWFDDDQNGVSVLTTRLSADTNTVQDATGSKLGALMQAVGTLIIGAVMSLFYSWKMTCVCFLGVPVVASSLVIESVLTRKANVKTRQYVEQSTKVALESITHIRTVASLGQESLMLERYNKALSISEKSQSFVYKLRGVVLALGYSALNTAYSFAILYSIHLITKEGVPFQNTIIVAETILFGCWLVCQLLSFAPNISAGREAAGRLFSIIDRKPQLYNAPHDTGKVDSGDVTFSQVSFAYPKRLDTIVLKNLDLNILKGQTIALVGLSGSGKSTCIQLLQRFYDPVSGTISIGDNDILQVPLHRLRAEFGIVSQEPVLFDRTIAENIAYGDNSRDIPLADIIEAAKKANVHEFISSLPAGYDTRLGSRGMQLSGGQKQRIAIARALIRNPSILILDEATSALDTQNEKIVQEALEGAIHGRTCIMIAHRMSTVARCNIIYVMSNGEVVERGTHSELLKLNNYYAQLVRQQS